MSVLIQLDWVDVNYLVPHLVPDSDLGKRAVVVLSNVKAKHCYCTESESFELLQIAKEFCVTIHFENLSGGNHNGCY